jgi:type II secretory pathway pseudopilin PulG
MMRAKERGFTLLEVLIATGLTVCVLLAVTSAVSNSLRVAALTDREAALNDDALSVLSDIRAISAYDPAMLKKLAGRHATMALNPGVAAETISVSISATPSASDLLATATVSQGGATVTHTQTLYLEAPAPGSSVGD